MTRAALQPIRVYADTSVYGGVFDEEFADASQGPPRVREWYERFESDSEEADIPEPAVLLQQAYLAAGIVNRRWEADALHVAVATVSQCPLIVSWNFKHIVSFQKIPLYNGVNLSHGHGTIAIHSPLEVIEGEDQDV